MNILLDYLYRDGGNNKFWGQAVFSNASRMSLARIEELICANLSDECFFIAEKVSVPTLYPPIYDAELDHGWHEFSSVEEISQNCAPFSGQDIQDFLTRLQHQ